MIRFVFYWEEMVCSIDRVVASELEGMYFV